MSQTLTTNEAPHYLKEKHGVTVSAATLESKRSRGGGPKFEKFLGKVIYRPEALDDWVRSELSPRSHTGEAA